MGTIRIPPSGGGIPDGTIKSYSVDTALTSADAGKAILCNPSTYLLKLTLPDATTMSTGAYKFLFRNVSAYTVLLYDAAGNHIAKILDNGMLTLHLKDNSTAAGVWSPSEKYRLSGTTLGDGYLPQELFQNGGSSELNPRWYPYSQLSTWVFSITWLTSDIAMIAGDASGGSSAVGVATARYSQGKWVMLDNTVNYGISTNGSISVVATSSTQAALFYKNGSNYPCRRTVTVEASTGKITALSSETVMLSGACQNIATSRFPGTNKFVAVFDRPGSTYSRYCAAIGTESGGSYSVTTYTASPDTENYPTTFSVVGISSTMAVVAALENIPSAVMKVRTLSSTGTFGTQATLTGSLTTGVPGLAALSSTDAVAVGNNTSQYPTAWPLAVSGSTVTPGTAYVIKSTTAYNYPTAVGITTTDSIAHFTETAFAGGNEGCPALCRMNLNAGVITMGTLEYLRDRPNTGARYAICSPGSGLVFAGISTQSGASTNTPKLRAFTQTLTAPLVGSEGV